jgi:hypothetical protein
MFDFGGVAGRDGPFTTPSGFARSSLHCPMKGGTMSRRLNGFPLKPPPS